jgi:hypothetical protein
VESDDRGCLLLPLSAARLASSDFFCNGRTTFPGRKESRESLQLEQNDPNLLTSRTDDDRLSLFRFTAAPQHTAQLTSKYTSSSPGLHAASRPCSLADDSTSPPPSVDHPRHLPLPLLHLLPHQPHRTTHEPLPSSVPPLPSFQSLLTLSPDLSEGGTASGANLMALGYDFRGLFTLFWIMIFLGAVRTGSSHVHCRSEGRRS